MHAIVLWVGAALVLAGVLHSLRAVLFRGPLSGSRTLEATEKAETLEPPRGPPRSMGLAWEWPSIALIGAGGLLLLAGAVAEFMG